MNKELTTIKELIAEMKAQFSKSVDKFDTAVLADGVTTIEYDALEVGMPVFVVADGERIPAPEGTHSLSGELAGVSIVVDAEGIITEVIDERQNEGAGEVVVEETTAESMSADQVESIVNAKLESFSKAVEGLAEMTKTIVETNNTLINELSNLKSEFEAFKAKPSVETKEAEKFSKVGNLTARQLFLKNSKI
jgi:transcriptional accessory protein Tex/SPT6